jgi:hypothetical protein
VGRRASPDRRSDASSHGAEDRRTSEGWLTVREVGWLGVVWLVMGGAALWLFVARLWSSLPPDPEFRRRLAGWLVALAVVTALYAVWGLRAARLRRSMRTPQPWMERTGH